MMKLIPKGNQVRVLRSNSPIFQLNTGIVCRRALDLYRKMVQSNLTGVITVHVVSVDVDPIMTVTDTIARNL